MVSQGQGKLREFKIWLDDLKIKGKVGEICIIRIFRRYDNNVKLHPDVDVNTC